MASPDSQVLKSLLAGACAGMSSTAVCHPFDTGVYKAVIFSANSTMAKLIQKDGEPLSLPQQAVCGAFAGAANSFVVTPVELVRNRLQVQYHSVADGASAQYSGPLDCMRQIVRQGGVRAMFQGIDATLNRDFFGVGLWFLTFQTVLRSFPRREGEKPTTLQVLISGACGGVGFWAWALPLDTVKSLMQCDQSGRYRHALDCLKQTVREQGVQRLFTGWQVAFSRGVPGAAITFSVHNAAMELMEKREQERNVD